MANTRTDPYPKVKRRRPPCPSFRSKRIVGLVLCVFLLPGASQAQAPSADWRTLETEHFRVHYPQESEAWTQHVASRLESVRQRVTDQVGYDLEPRTDVLVVDPYARANGTAYAILRRPRMVLYTTPPPPDSIIGHYRDWGELLTIHEDVHLVHLSRPSRHPMRSWIERLLPIGPVAAKVPRWVAEGYATLLEGQLTGYGRPNSDLQAAILRRKAQLGELPSYDQLDGDGRWFGFSMAYLMGSAYLDWLVEREGPDSLRHLWRRLSAHQNREFSGAFAGVFGDTPRRLYNRFCAEITYHAIAMERELEATLNPGELWQDLSWSTGSPALSPDGEQLAVVQRSADDPPRLVVWSTRPDPEAEDRWNERVAKLQERDPLDVPAVRRKPLRRDSLFELPTRHGRRPSSPRFSPDGRSIFFVSYEPDAQGFLAPDLFRVSPEEGRVERLTRGANLREIDPSPDGRFVFGVRHRHGLSQLVRLELATGDLEPLGDESRAGVTFSQPRVHPDGDSLAFVRNRGEGWELIVRDLASGAEALQPTPPYAFIAHPTWSSDGKTLYASVGDAGQIDIRAYFPGSEHAPRTITRTLGAALSAAPTPDGSALFFLSLEADGFDLRRLALNDPEPPEFRIAGSMPLEPIEPIQPGRENLNAPRLDVAPVEDSKPYGLGRQEWLPLIGGTYAPGGRSATVGVRVGDMVGRTSLVAALTHADGAFDGGSLAFRWRGWPIEVGLQAWSGEERPSRQPSIEGFNAPALDLDRDGIEIMASWNRRTRRWRMGLDLGVALENLGRLEVASASFDRQRAFVDFQQRSQHRWGGWRLRQELDLDLQRGETEDHRWMAGGARLRLDGGTDSVRLGLTWHRRAIDDARLDIDRLQLGGLDELYLPRSVERSRLSAPALPRGTLVGDDYEHQRLDLQLGGTPARIFWERHRLWPDGGTRGEWLALRGAEIRWTLPPMPILRLPAIDFQAGIAESLDPPFDDEIEGWIQIGFRP